MNTELDRAWYVFAVAPERLSWRHYETYITAYRVDHRIALLRDSGQWPEPVDIRARWPDLDNLMTVTGHLDRPVLTIGNVGESRKLLLAPANVPDPELPAVPLRPLQRP